jgi:hypothetical protein
MYDDLPHDANVSFKRVQNEHDDENTEITVGRKETVDGPVFRLEVYWNENSHTFSPWYDGYAFEAFLDGILLDHNVLSQL